LKAGKLSIALLRGALATLPFVARATQAQTIQSSIDLGAMGLRYADTINTAAAVVSPYVIADWGSGFAEGSATFSQFTSGGSSGQAVLSGSRFLRTGARFFAELAGLAGGSTHSDGTRTGEIVANGRLHFPGGRGEVFAGAGLGRTWDGAAWRSLVLGEAGAALGSADRNALVSLSPAIVNDSTRYADLQTSLSWRTARADLGAVLGARFGDQVTTPGSSARSWASVSAARQLTARVGVTVSGGTYPIDPTQGFPGGRFISVAVRLNSLGRRAATPAAIQPVDSATNSPPDVGVTAFQVARDREGKIAFHVTAPAAVAVEINGDFTNWTPLPLTPDPRVRGQWSITLPIGPGHYQMNVRVDGNKWMVPPGLLSVQDEFGGAVGLLVLQ
jgi:hypothetical protein